MNQENSTFGPYNPRTMSLSFLPIELTGQGTLLLMSRTGSYPRRTSVPCS